MTYDPTCVTQTSEIMILWYDSNVYYHVIIII